MSQLALSAGCGWLTSEAGVRRDIIIGQAPQRSSAIAGKAPNTTHHRARHVALDE
jgi:hypothetical protein